MSAQASLPADAEQNEARSTCHFRCTKCAEVSQRVLKAIETGPDKPEDVGRDTLEFDRIDLGTQAEFESRSNCGTCAGLKWTFNSYPRRGLMINSALRRLSMSLRVTTSGSHDQLQLIQDSPTVWGGDRCLKLCLVR
jgi:hypothetical protein